MYNYCYGMYTEISLTFETNKQTNKKQNKTQTKHKIKQKSKQKKKQTNKNKDRRTKKKRKKKPLKICQVFKLKTSVEDVSMLHQIHFEKNAFTVSEIDWEPHYTWYRVHFFRASLYQKKIIFAAKFKIHILYWFSVVKNQYFANRNNF